MSGQRLLRPDQVEAALVMAAAGSKPEEVAAALAVDVGLVERTFRLEAEKPAPPIVLGVPLPAEEGRWVLGRVVEVGERLALRHLPRPEGWRAPHFISDSAAWPPAPTPEDAWVVLPITEGRETVRTALRLVTLWDERVLVDDVRRVLCRRCLRLVPVVELGQDLFRGRDGVMGGGLPVHELGLPSLPAGAV